MTDTPSRASVIERCAVKSALMASVPDGRCPMRQRSSQSAVEKTYGEFIRISRKFLDEASSDFRNGHAALAQTQIDLAQRLLDLTAMLSRLLNSIAPSVEEWSRWKRSLTDTADVAGWPGASSATEIHARKFLERVLLVRWGDLSSMRAPLPEIREATVRQGAR